MLPDPSTINPKLVTVPRLRAMRLLTEVGADGISFRELQAALADMTDGNLVSTLHSLSGLGLLHARREKVATKHLTVYTMTPDGRRQWRDVCEWLHDWTQTP